MKLLTEDGAPIRLHGSERDGGTLTFCLLCDEASWNRRWFDRHTRSKRHLDNVPETVTWPVNWSVPNSTASPVTPRRSVL